MKRAIFGAIGLLLVIGTIGSVKNLGSWSNGEQVGYNVWTILAIALGVYLVYKALQKEIPPSNQSKQ